MTRWRINIFAATWLSYAGFYFCRKGYGIAKPVLKEEYQFDDLQLAHIWTAYLVAYMIGQFMSAKLGQRFACRTLLLIGMAISIVMNICIGGTVTGGPEMFWMLIGFLSINGFAQATGWPGNVGMLAKWTRRSERGRVMAWWGTCYMIGSIMAKHFAAFMLAWLGVAWSFWGAAAVLFSIWILFYFWGQEEPQDVGLELIEEVEVDVEAEADAAPKEAARPWEEVFRVVMIMGVLYFCFKFTRYALDSWGPMLIREGFSDEVDSATAGHLSTIFDWVGFLGVIVGGYASDKLFRSERMPVVTWMSVAMCGVCLVWWLFGANNLWLFVGCMGFIGFTMMGPDSLLSGTAAMDISTKEKAVVASGIINGLGSIGPVIQEEVLGYVKVTMGQDAVLAIIFGMSIVAVLGSAALWMYTRRRGLAL